MRPSPTTHPLAFLALLLLLATPLRTAEYSGTVVGVSDGDTMTRLTPEKQRVKIRLGETDTPELGNHTGLVLAKLYLILRLANQRGLSYRTPTATAAP